MNFGSRWQIVPQTVKAPCATVPRSAGLGTQSKLPDALVNFFAEVVFAIIQNSLTY